MNTQIFDALPPARRLKAFLRPAYRAAREWIQTIRPIPGFFAEKRVNLAKMRHYRREFFPAAGPFPWLDRPNAAEELERKLAEGQITADQAEVCRHWMRDGYAVIPGLIPHSELDRIWSAYESAVRANRVRLEPEPGGMNDPYPGRFLNPHLHVPELRELLENQGIRKWLAVLMEREILPFQTITAHKGSQQKTHSDAIHMTTYPLGYMTAAWIAFEDIHADSGPLAYYPGSHRLPYYLSREVGIGPEEYRQRGYDVYSEKYEPFVEALIEEKNLKPSYFRAKKGDVLLWHHNLLHGGSRRNNLDLPRKSVVCHYFVRGAVCYHDLASNLASLDR